jgi:arylsulfatase A-like enzyme
MAEASAVFDLAYSPTSITAPSHATLFTGQHPFNHGLWNNGQVLIDVKITISEILSKEGYDTAAIVSTFVLDDRFGFAQGFNHYDDSFSENEATIRLDRWRDYDVKGAFDRRGDYTTDRAIAWLDARSPDRPFFLFVHYFDPHSPYVSPEDFHNLFTEGIDPASDPIEIARAWYDAEIAFTDAQFGRLIESLKQREWFDDTIVVLTADHGEGLMDHGYELHGLKIFEEEVHIPLVISWPGHVRPARHAGSVVLADVVPTVLSLLEIETDAAFDGSDLSPAIAGGRRLDPNRPIYLYRRRMHKSLQPSALPQLVQMDPALVPKPIYVNGEQFGLRTGDWKYIIAPDEGQEYLFNLIEDPGEHNNLADTEPARAVAMKHELEIWIGARPPLAEAERALDEEERARLRALGYTN